MGGSSSSRMVDDGHAMPCLPSYFCDVVESSKFTLQPNGGGGAAAQLSAAADVQEPSVRIENRRNIKKLAKDPPAAMAELLAGKPDQVHKDKTVPRSKFSAESLKITEGNRKKVDYSTAPKQVWRAKEKPEPSENAMESLPAVQQSVKGKAGGLRDSAEWPVQGSLSKSIYHGRRPRKNKCPAEATVKSGKQTSAAPKQVVPVKNKRVASNNALNLPSTVLKARELTQPLDAGMARDMTEPCLETFKFGAEETISKPSSGKNPPEKARQKVQQKVEPARAIKKTRNQSPPAPAPNQSSKAKGKRELGKEKVKPAKEKAKPSDAPPKSSSKPNSSRRRRQRRKQAGGQYSIECQDMVEEIGHECLLCEKDLIYSPLTSNEEATYDEAIYQEAESCKLPDVAVLPCGHAFHVLCLEDDILSTDQMTDPLCFLCQSLC